jgi:hypothetical protein
MTEAHRVRYLFQPEKGVAPWAFLPEKGNWNRRPQRKQSKPNALFSLWPPVLSFGSGNLRIEVALIA